MSKVHTTNYYNTLITVATDCNATEGFEPPLKGDKKTIANFEFEKIYNAPYQYTSDELMFEIFAFRKEIPKAEFEEAKNEFFSKGQPCMRCSALGKRYGWGIHYNETGKMALVPIESDAYQTLLKDEKIKKVAAMKSRK